MGAASAAAAQPVPSEHAQHQASGQDPVSPAGQQCCCEEMMHKMMSEMMQKHQGMGMPASKANADQHAPAADDHQHKQ
jgi:hypothetical protein